MNLLNNTEKRLFLKRFNYQLCHLILRQILFQMLFNLLLTKTPISRLVYQTTSNNNKKNIPTILFIPILFHTLFQPKILNSKKKLSKNTKRFLMKELLPKPSKKNMMILLNRQQISKLMKQKPIHSKTLIYQNKLCHQILFQMLFNLLLTKTPISRLVYQTTSNNNKKNIPTILFIPILFHTLFQPKILNSKKKLSKNTKRFLMKELLPKPSKTNMMILLNHQ